MAKMAANLKTKCGFSPQLPSVLWLIPSCLLMFQSSLQQYSHTHTHTHTLTHTLTHTRTHTQAHHLLVMRITAFTYPIHLILTSSRRKATCTCAVEIMITNDQLRSENLSPKLLHEDRFLNKTAY